MKNLSKDMEETVNNELQMFYRMSGVMVQMLMFEAESKNVTLEADVGYMENYKALEEMKDFESRQIEGDMNSAAFMLNPLSGKSGKLNSLGGKLGNALMN